MGSVEIIEFEEKYHDDLKAKERGAKRIILYSNHKLAPALVLYEKLGFKYVTHVNTKYAESDIKMELNL